MNRLETSVMINQSQHDDFKIDDYLNLVNIPKKRLKHELRHWIGYCYKEEVVMKNEREIKDILVLRACIRDLLAAEMFTLEGLAEELQTPLDVIVDLVAMRPVMPSFSLGVSLLDLYNQCFPKIKKDGID